MSALFLPIPHHVDFFPFRLPIRPPIPVTRCVTFSLFWVTTSLPFFGLFFLPFKLSCCPILSKSLVCRVPFSVHLYWSPCLSSPAIRISLFHSIPHLVLHVGPIQVFPILRCRHEWIVSPRSPFQENEPLYPFPTFWKTLFLVVFFLRSLPPSPPPLNYLVTLCRRRPAHGPPLPC